jgi:UDP:flavonoid glycosyltransferase YjiC (YdhE family)
MGSQIYYQPHLFSAVAQALPDEDIQLIFAINELYHSPFRHQLPANVIAVPYAPQLQVLPHVQLVISHGGANSVMESLAHGIPVALLPICNDQFLQAQFVTWAGTGIVLDPHAPNPATYRQQLLPLLHPQSPVAQQATTTGNAFRSKTGAQEAATLVQQLYHTRQPVMPPQ